MGILKFQEVLTQKIEGKVHVYQDDFVSDLQHTNYELISFCYFSESLLYFNFN